MFVCTEILMKNWLFVTDRISRDVSSPLFSGLVLIVQNQCSILTGSFFEWRFVLWLALSVWKAILPSDLVTISNQKLRSQCALTSDSRCNWRELSSFLSTCIYAVFYPPLCTGLMKTLFGFAHFSKRESVSRFIIKISKATTKTQPVTQPIHMVKHGFKSSRGTFNFTKVVIHYEEKRKWCLHSCSLTQSDNTI